MENPRKDDKYLSEKMKKMKEVNEAIAKRRQEVLADQKWAEKTGSSITTVINKPKKTVDEKLIDPEKPQSTSSNSSVDSQISAPAEMHERLWDIGKTISIDGSYQEPEYDRSWGRNTGGKEGTSDLVERNSSYRFHRTHRRGNQHRHPENIKFGKSNPYNSAEKEWNPNKSEDFNEMQTWDQKNFECHSIGRVNEKYQSATVRQPYNNLHRTDGKSSADYCYSTEGQCRNTYGENKNFNDPEEEDKGSRISLQPRDRVYDNFKIIKGHNVELNQNLQRKVQHTHSNYSYDSDSDNALRSINDPISQPHKSLKGRGRGKSKYLCNRKNYEGRIREASSASDPNSDCPKSFRNSNFQFHSLQRKNEACDVKVNKKHNVASCQYPLGKVVHSTWSDDSDVEHVTLQSRNLSDGKERGNDLYLSVNYKDSTSKSSGAGYEASKSENTLCDSNMISSSQSYKAFDNESKIEKSNQYPSKKVHSNWSDDGSDEEKRQALLSFFRRLDEAAMSDNEKCPYDHGDTESDD